MSERLNRHKYIVDMGANNWFRLVANPYIMAYDTAFESFKEYTKKQHEADQARVDMFIMAASLVTSSIFMAAVASASLQRLARRGAISVLGRENLTAAFNLAKVAKNSEPFMFGVGKVLDEAKSQITKVAQEAMGKVVAPSINILSNTSIVTDKHLDTILRNYVDAAYQCGLAFEDSRTLTAAQKDQGFAALSKAAICNPPRVRIDVAKLAAKIELCMYMNMILDSDRLVKVPMADRDRIGQLSAAIGSKKEAINLSPFQKEYPQSTAPARMPGSTLNSSYQYVEFNRPGSILRKRIDEVCRASIRKNFYSAAGDMGKRELEAAQLTLVVLARETRPLGLSDVKN